MGMNNKQLIIMVLSQILFTLISYEAISLSEVYGKEVGVTILGITSAIFLLIAALKIYKVDKNEN